MRTERENRAEERKRGSAEGKDLLNAGSGLPNFLTSALCTSALLILVAFVTIPSLSLAAEADELVAKIQKAYENIKDVKGNFVQKNYIKDLKRTDTYKGQFFIKPPRMKWEFTGEKPQTVYITGDTIIIYQKSEKQAFKAKFDRATYGQAPIALLGGFGTIKEEFEVSAKNGILVLKPKKPLGTIDYLEITPAEDGFPIKALRIIDSLGNRIEITLSNVKVNTKIKDSVFEFSPPEGVNIIQQ